MVRHHSVISSTHHIFTLVDTSASPVSDEIHANIIHIYIVVQTKANILLPVDPDIKQEGWDVNNTICIII